MATKPLPRFREDLEIYRGPDAADGTPTYHVYDPIRTLYFKITWAESVVMQAFAPGMTLNELTEAVNQNTTLKVTPEEINAFFLHAERQGLLAGTRKSSLLLNESEQKKVGFFKWLILHYLFIKIPLVNPDSFLTRTLPRVRPLLSPKALLIYGLVSVWGMSLLLSRWSEFAYTFSYFFNLKGIVVYAFAIFCTKVIHELSHAYVGKKYGLRIPTMGVAFLVLWPVLYTDASDSWRLRSRFKRLAVAGAGIVAELVLAGLATIGWAVTSPGLLNSVFFVVASANWLTTLAINLNPAMRFDGYYIFSDLLGVENLQPRAFNLARRELYHLFLGVTFPNPEPKMSRNKQIGLIVYAIYTWIYRIFLYTAIAVFVYFKFTKVLGIFLFLLEIGIFLVRPAIQEFQVFLRFRSQVKWNVRLLFTTFALTLFTVWFVLPWPHAIDVPATTVAVENQTLYVPIAGVITDIYVERGDTVKKGSPLLRVASKELETQLAILEREKSLHQKQLEIIQQSDEELSKYLETQAELIQTEAELEGVKEQQAQNTLTAKVDGQLYSWDDKLFVGLYLSEGIPLGQIASRDQLDVVCYVSENDVSDLYIGQEVTFRSYSGMAEVKGKVKRIGAIRAEFLLYPQLGSEYAGDLPVVVEKEGELRLIESYYPVQITLEETDSLLIGETGEVYINGPWRSKLVNLVRYVLSILFRESGF